MTHQALSLEGIPPCHAPHRPFFERFGYLGTCVLPAEVLDATPDTDPDTDLTEPSLRQRCSQDGELCYARVLYSFAEGLYWANVSATPDLDEAERIILTEVHLLYALAWDERLSWRTPSRIRRMMQAQAEELAPLHPSPVSETPVSPFPTPLEPLTIVTTVEVTTDELREAFVSHEADHTPEAQTSSRLRAKGVCRVQQGLLRALERALLELLETATDAYTAHVLEALSALVARVKRWQWHSRQRVVNAVRAWDAARNVPAWALTLGVPAALLAAA